MSGATSFVGELCIISLDGDRLDVTRVVPKFSPQMMSNNRVDYG